jgi:hypothetical protein
MFWTGPGNSASDIARTLLLALLNRALNWTRSLKKMRKILTSGEDGRVAPVYDLLNCGPRNRFCTPNLVVHNCLGAGYGAGAAKFKVIAKAMAGLDLTLAECKEAISEFRESNPKIPDFWYRMDAGLKMAANRREDFRIFLPSGRCLEYRNPHFEMGSISAQFERGGTFYRLWGAVAVENATQATARDIFTHGLLLAEEKGLADLSFHVHDEGVWLGDSTGADDTLHEIEKCMSTPPPWAEDLPLGADGVHSEFYCKPD